MKVNVAQETKKAAARIERNRAAMRTVLICEGLACELSESVSAWGRDMVADDCAPGDRADGSTPTQIHDAIKLLRRELSKLDRIVNG